MAGTLLRAISPALPFLVLMVSNQVTPECGHPGQVHIAHCPHSYKGSLFQCLLSGTVCRYSLPPHPPSILPPPPTPFPGWLLCHRLQLALGVPRHSIRGGLFREPLERVRIVLGVISGKQVMAVFVLRFKMPGEGEGGGGWLLCFPGILQEINRTC